MWKVFMTKIFKKTVRKEDILKLNRKTIPKSGVTILTLVLEE
jgi:hypothetical protein